MYNIYPLNIKLLVINSIKEIWTCKGIISIIPGTGVDSLTGLEDLLPFAGPSGSAVLSASTITCKVIHIPAGIIKY